MMFPSQNEPAHWFCLCCKLPTDICVCNGNIETPDECADCLRPADYYDLNHCGYCHKSICPACWDEHWQDKLHKLHDEELNDAERYA